MKMSCYETGNFLAPDILNVLNDRALTRILKTGVQDSHLGVPLQKSWSPTNLCIPYIFSILAGSDTFD